MSADDEPFMLKRDDYIRRLKPLFLPADPVKNDIICRMAFNNSQTFVDAKDWKFGPNRCI